MSKEGNPRRLGFIALVACAGIACSMLLPADDDAKPFTDESATRNLTAAEQRAKLAPHRPKLDTSASSAIKEAQSNPHHSHAQWSATESASALDQASNLAQAMALLPPGCQISQELIEQSNSESSEIRPVAYDEPLWERQQPVVGPTYPYQQSAQGNSSNQPVPRQFEPLPSIGTQGPVFNGLMNNQSNIESSHEVAWNPHAKATAANRQAQTGNLANGSAPNQSNSTQLASAKNTSGGYPAQATDDEVDPHYEIFSRDCFPSATQCATCHQQIYDEWAISNHAYAGVSPMFHKFEQKINDLSQGTVGYFCLRCHAPVAVTMGLRRDQAIWDGPRVFREGVTCVACHRVNEQYGKVNGERRMVAGDLAAPVYGAQHGAGVAYAIENKSYYSVKTDPNEKGPGQVIHQKAIQFEQLSRADFCMSCHQVAVDPQIKLEVVWDQYRASPARKQGITCQDCHMGRVPGVSAGYSVGPAAVVNDRIINPARKHSNHVFYGPGGSIAHPGIFPQNPKADRWTFNDWLMFDWRAGWGTDEFEDRYENGMVYANFPEVWSNIDDRYDAREILDANFKKLEYKNELRKQVMENGAKVEGPFFEHTPQIGQDLKLHYLVTNTNPGHNLPSGSLGAQPQVWLNAVLIGPNGQRVWESGYVDSNGDVADLHSKDVLANLIPHDSQLFNLQTKFLTTNVKGTDREMYLPVNLDIDQIPFLRPGAQPVSVINHPPFIRMEAHSLPALGSRKAHYRIPKELLTQPGCYRLSVRMRSRSEPIYFMQFVGATEEMQLAMNESIIDCHEYSVQFFIR